MLKARRQHQKTKKLLDGAAKQAKRLMKQALAGPAVKKEKVKKEKVKKEKVNKEKVETEKVTKKSGAGTGKKGAS
jgi:truncated hemoglobin YjbI